MCHDNVCHKTVLGISSSHVRHFNDRFQTSEACICCAAEFCCHERAINFFDIFRLFLAISFHFFSGTEKAPLSLSLSLSRSLFEQVQRFLRNADWKLLARPTERFKIREKHRVKSIEVVRGGRGWFESTWDGKGV